jgi:hypothetical protein
MYKELSGNVTKLSPRSRLLVKKLIVAHIMKTSSPSPQPFYETGKRESVKEFYDKPDEFSPYFTPF